MERRNRTRFSSSVFCDGLPKPAEHCHEWCELAGFSQGRPEIPAHTAPAGAPPSPASALLARQCMLPAIGFCPRRVVALACLDDATTQRFVTSYGIRIDHLSPVRTDFFVWSTLKVPYYVGWYSKLCAYFRQEE